MNDNKFNLCWDDFGLTPAIIQDDSTGEVRMLGWMNEEALAKTIETGEVHFFSRSRKRLWKKGETSGNTLSVSAVRLDCDGDALLILAKPNGPTCHTGDESCFHRKILNDMSVGPELIADLWRTIQQRKSNPSESSYTSKLFSKGKKRIAQKIGEEGLESALALATGDKVELICEMADLLYHSLVGLVEAGVTPGEITNELARRRK